MGNWQKDTKKFERIKQGSPSAYWSYGLARRLDFVDQFISFKNKKILDVGCGVGIFLDKFSVFGGEPYGIDVDKEKIKIAKKTFSNVKIAQAEAIPFQDNMFDIVWLHEVIEHVDDDKKAISECFRVLKSKGYLVIFAPNRLWPFETHGIYFKKKYIFGNIPLVTWLPNFLYRKITPHVRNYTEKGLLRLIEGKHKIIQNSYVFPGYDGLIKKFGVIGRLVRDVFEIFEKTPLKVFGISHFVIIQKID